MKKFFRSLIILLLPALFAELLLYNSSFLHYIIKQAPPTEWTDGLIGPNIWPNTLIMGSSLMRGAVDNKSLEQQLSKDGNVMQVGDIAIPSDALSHDYFTLYRITKTCQQCPKRIILGIFDLALKEKEASGWYNTTQGRISQNYMFDQRSNIILDQAGLIDDAFIKHKQTLVHDKQLRLFFLRDKLLFIVKNNIYRFIVHQPSSSPVLVKTQNTSDPSFGYWPYEQKLSDANPQDSLNNYKEYLGVYKVGGSAELFLNQIVDLAHKNDMEIVLVLTPLTNIYQQTFSMEVKTYENYMLTYGVLRNVRIIDAIHLMPNDYSKYSDTNHLNKYGSVDFTKYLAEELTKNN